MTGSNKLLKSNVIKGFGTLIMREFFLKLFSFAGQIFLARLLVPSDFGTYVMIVFIINVVALFSDVGLSLAIIQRDKNPGKTELSSVFNLKILLAIVLMVIVWLSAPYAKLFYPSFADINIVTMLRIFSITIFLTALRAVPIAQLERKIKYNVISIIDVIGVIAYYLIAISAASFNFGVWSFIIASVLKETIETIVVYMINPFIPTFRIRWSALKQMIRFGAFIQGNNLLTFLSGSITPIIGGRMSGPYAVGLLDLADSLSSLPEIIAVNFGRVAFAGYSRIQKQRNLLSRSAYKSIGLLTIILFIFPVILISFGSELVRFLYTEKWAPAISALYWFSAAVVFYPIVTVLGQVILAVGKSKQIFYATVFTALIGGITAYALVRMYGFIGIAMANLLIYFILCTSYIYILKKYEFIIFPFISSTFYKTIGGIFTILFSVALNFLFPQSVIFLTIKIVLALIFYTFSMYLFAKSETKELLSLVVSLIKNKRI